MTQARWPQVDCHRIFTHQMISRRFQGGERQRAVPRRTPGLGVNRRRCRVGGSGIDPLPNVPAPGCCSQSDAHGATQLLRRTP